MKKKYKTFLLTSISLLVVGAAISVNTTLSNGKFNTKSTLLETKVDKNSYEEEILEKNISDEITPSTTKDISLKFQGIILTKKDVADLGWATKTELTLVDWEAAPNVIEIGANAFEGSILTSIIIPDSIIRISRTAFLSTSATLKTIQFPYKSNLVNETNSYNALYGFTQEQWNSIEWRDIPTKDVKINSIIARNLLKQDPVLSWRELSAFRGITADSFKNSSLQSITIEYNKNFVIDNNAFSGTNELTVINISEIYRANIIKFGLTESQMSIVSYLPISANSDTVNTIAISLLVVAVLIAGVGFTFMVRGLMQEMKLEKSKLQAGESNENNQSLPAQDSNASLNETNNDEEQMGLYQEYQ